MASKLDLLGGVLGGAVALVTGHAPGCDCPKCVAGLSFGAGLARGVAKVAARRARRRRGARGEERPAELGGAVGELPVRGELVERVEPRPVEVVVTAVRTAPPKSSR